MCLWQELILAHLFSWAFSLWFLNTVWMVNKGHQFKETAMKMGRVSGCKADGLAVNWLVCPLLAGSSSGRHVTLPVPLAAPAGQVVRDNTGIYAANTTRLFCHNLSYSHCMFLSNCPDLLTSRHLFSNLLPSALTLYIWQEGRLMSWTGPPQY